MKCSVEKILCMLFVRKFPEKHGVMILMCKQDHACARLLRRRSKAWSYQNFIKLGYWDYMEWEELEKAQRV
jgi:hypothetical protein